MYFIFDEDIEEIIKIDSIINRIKYVNNVLIY